MKSNSNNLNLIRLTLATIVVWSHCFDISQGDGVGDDISRLTHGRISVSFTAVDLFFIISGYLISKSWLSKNDAKIYIQKRFLRIAPAFLVSILFSIVISLLFLTSSPFEYFKYLLSNRFNIFQTFFFFEYPKWLDFNHVFEFNPYPCAVNHSLWTIQYEVICYCFVGVLGSFGILSKRPVFAFFILFFLLYVGEFCFSKNPHGSYWRLFCNFFAGIMFNFIQIEKFIMLPFNLLFAFLLIVSVIIPVDGLFFLLTPFVCGYFLFYVSAIKWLKMPFVQRNDISYGTYVYAWPIQQAMQSVFAVHNPYVLFLMCLPVVYGVGYISWIYIEKPFLKPKEAPTGSVMNLHLPPESESSKF